MIKSKEIAECVGLWLAEGDNKTDREITFTNNCFELIIFFSENIQQLYKGHNKPRIYVYSPTEKILIKKLGNFVVRNYVDKRANRTYFIFKLADVEFVKKWRSLVNSMKNQDEYYSDILRGIFAGEGNIKHDLKNHNSRNVRIASGSRNSLIEKILSSINIKFRYDQEKREYWITGRHLYKLEKIKIASLHPEKESKFRSMINSVKERHYSPGELKTILQCELNQFKTTSELANKFRKSDLRILEVLRELKKENRVGYIKLKGHTYWMKKEIKDKYLYKERIKILKQVNKNKNMTAIGKTLNLGRKAINHRLIKFEKEGLVEKRGTHWMIKEKANTLLGIDESGSEL